MFRTRQPFNAMFFIIALTSSVVSSQAWGLRSDREKPIDIKADRVEISEREEVSQYIGNVHLKQGSMDIKANTITVYLKQGQLHKIVITGTPAVFSQQPDNRKEIVRSSAHQMEYFAGKQHLILKTNAEVIQGENHFRGDFIEYDTLNSVVKARKDEGSDSRVHAIIRPGKDDQPPPDQNQPKTVTPE